MSLARIRDEYRVPARLGARVTMHCGDGTDRTGTITGAQGDLLEVQPDTTPLTHLIHPDFVTWSTT